MTSTYTPEQLAALSKEDQGPEVTGIVITFTVFALISVLLRFFSRLKFVGNVGLEDYAIAISMVFSIAMGVAQIEQVRWGNGKHVMFLKSMAEAEWILKWLFVSILAYSISLTLTKISILLQYRRIFSNKQDRIPIYVVMGIVVAYGVESIFSGTFSCIPVDAFWDLMKQPTAKCINQNALYYANAGINVATDLTIAALPVKGIWKLQIAQKQKIALLIILTLGWFVCIVSILRLNALITLGRNPQDTTWYGAPTAYWSAIEVNLAIVCASTPALKPLIVRIIPAFSSRRGTKNSGISTDPSSRGSKSNKSFMRLKGKQSHSTMDDDTELESGLTHDVRASPDLQYPAPTQGQIMVTRHMDTKSEKEARISQSESQRSLVALGAQ